MMMRLICVYVEAKTSQNDLKPFRYVLLSLYKLR